MKNTQSLPRQPALVNAPPLNEIGALHFAWVERMGWHNRTPLESLALIGSEISESADECLDDVPTPAFGEELADIVLRCVDFAQTEDVDLDAEVFLARVVWRSPSLAGRMHELNIDWGKWVNTVRRCLPEGERFGSLPEFRFAMGRVVRRVLLLAQDNGIDMAAELHRKMAINELRGTRGRSI